MTPGFGLFLAFACVVAMLSIVATLVCGSRVEALMFGVATLAGLAAVIVLSRGGQ